MSQQTDSEVVRAGGEDRRLIADLEDAVRLAGDAEVAVPVPMSGSKMITTATNAVCKEVRGTGMCISDREFTEHFSPPIRAGPAGVVHQRWRFAAQLQLSRREKYDTTTIR